MLGSSYKLSKSERSRRSFSESFKIKKVQELKSGQTRIFEIVREYSVSRSSVYKWINKYGMSNKKKPDRLIIEPSSDTLKIQSLRKRVAELERIVGQKQIQLEFNKKMIDLAEDHYQIDIKKKFIEKQSDISGKTEKKSK